MIAQWALVMMGGLLGSAHCVGMCGSLALSVGASATSWQQNLLRQLCYSAGRIFTYAVLGAAAGYGVLRLTHSADGWSSAQSLVALLAGVLLVYEGLRTTGIWPRRRHVGLPPCLGSGFLGAFLAAPGWSGSFLAGVFTGFLPCGLVYAFLALAASTGSLWPAAASMTAFGLGTVPLMVLTGCGGSLLSVTARIRLLRLAGWCVLVSGLLSIYRGVGLWQAFAGSPLAHCPFCN